MGEPGVRRPSPVERRRRPWTWLWSLAGLVSVGIGAVGVIVPGLPTTVFFVVAAACFTRSSPRLERWVLDLPRVGRLVADHRAGLGMPRRAKVMAITMILVASVGSGAILIDARPVGAGVIVLGLIGAAYVAFRVPTRERVLSERLPAAP